MHLSWIKQEVSVFPDVQDRLGYNMVGSAHTWFRLYCCMVAGFPKVQFTAWQHVYDGVPWSWLERSKGPRVVRMLQPPRGFRRSMIILLILIRIRFWATIELVSMNMR